MDPLEILFSLFLVLIFELGLFDAVTVSSKYSGSDA